MLLERGVKYINKLSISRFITHDKYAKSKILPQLLSMQMFSFALLCDQMNKSFDCTTTHCSNMHGFTPFFAIQVPKKKFPYKFYTKFAGLTLIIRVRFILSLYISNGYLETKKTLRYINPINLKNIISDLGCNSFQPFVKAKQSCSVYI